MMLHNVGYGTQTTDGNSISNRDEVSLLCYYCWCSIWSDLFFFTLPLPLPCSSYSKCDNLTNYSIEHLIYLFYSSQALYVVKLYESLYEQYPSHREGVGIIAPYKAQRRLIKNMFRDRFGPSMGNVEISTIDGFQGREKDIVIFSCVRAPACGRGYQSSGMHHYITSFHFYLVVIDQQIYFDDEKTF